MSRERFTVAVAISAVVVGIALGSVLLIRSRQSPHLPYHDAFAQSEAREWTPYGGDWQLTNGMAMNRSDERGAKLITGSSKWSDYALDADLKMIGHEGNVGVIARVSEEEYGIDAYNGYYIGMRSSDSAIVIGRADHGWMAGRPDTMSGGVRFGVWYHFHVVAVGCQIAAEVTNLNTGAKTISALEEKACAARGKIGLRSVATGAAWRNVAVRMATENDLTALRARARAIQMPIYPVREDVFFRMMESNGEAQPAVNADEADTVLRYRDVATHESIPIAALHSWTAQSPHQTLRGVVTLAEPLYMQDATGGIALELGRKAALNAGDEIEVVGSRIDSAPSATFKAEEVYLLGDRTLVAPVAISSTQAADGDFDGRLVELRGRLRSKSAHDQRIILRLGDSEQEFQAVGMNPMSTAQFDSWETNSELRVRGICSVGRTHPAGSGGFTILLRSMNDVEVVSGPPWWTPRLLARYAVGFLAVLALAIMLYVRIVHWNMRKILEERERLAHDLHDTLAQSFAGVGFHLQGMRSSIRSGLMTGEAVLNSLDTACRMVAHTHREASDEIAARTPGNAHCDLLELLEGSTRTMLDGDYLPMKLVREGTPKPLSLIVRDALFQVGREAIANTIRHAHATTLTLRLIYTRQSIALEICDNGIGFDLESKDTSLGIRSMRRRSKRAGAELEIVSGPGEGTFIRIRAALRTGPPLIGWLWTRRWLDHER